MTSDIKLDNQLLIGENTALSETKQLYKKFVRTTALIMCIGWILFFVSGYLIIKHNSNYGAAIFLFSILITFFSAPLLGIIYDIFFRKHDK